MTRIDPSTLSHREAYGLLIDLIVPRPIAWVSTVDDRGRTNLAPFSFFNGISARPPLVSISVGRRRDGSKKDTARNAIDTGELVIHVVSEQMAESMNATSAEYAPGESEIDALGLATAPCEKVRPPRLADAPVALECRLVESLSPGNAAVDLLIAEILLAHVPDSAAGGDSPGVGIADLRPVGRLGGSGYCRVRDLFQMARPPRPSTPSGDN